MTKTVVSTTIFDLTSMVNIELAYYRPIARGRKIFGELVPYQHIWRTGADGNTTIYFSGDIEINGEVLPKGKYAIFTIPYEDRWDIIFYSDHANMGLPRVWADKGVALLTEVKPERSFRHIETFTMGVNNLGNNEGSIEMAWERTFVEIKFKLLNIPDVDASTADEFRMANFYYSAAEFYYELNELETALMLINRSFIINHFKPYFYYRLLALIEAAMGELGNAVESAKISLSLSENAGNEKYIQLNQQSVAQWTTQNVKEV